MTAGSQRGPQLLTAAFGILMVAAAGVRPEPAAVAVTALAAAAVLAGIAFRTAATAAVLVTVVAIVLSDPPPAFAALSGLGAVCYLLLRHAADTSAVTITGPTIAGALGFSVIGWLAASIPFDLPRIPLVAPLALVGLYVLVTRPFTPRPR